jgi:hypothetical protein
MKSFFFLVSLVICLFIPFFVFANKENNPVASDSWMEKAMENIEKEEYKPSLQEYDYKGDKFSSPRYHFANRANNLRAYVDESGLELLPRVAGEEKWNLKLKSIDYYGVLDVTLDGDNIKCADDEIEIIYLNSENGIRQNIIIEQKKIMGGIDFIIETENLQITPEKDKFVLNGKENEITYQITGVEDATGKDISYSLSVEGGKLCVLPDDENIIYPIKITANIASTNPSSKNLSAYTSAKSRGLDTLPDWINESNRLGVNYGWSVSSAGDVNGDGYSDVIIGAYEYDNGQIREGMAFVYHGNSSGLSLSASWTAESNQVDAYFGSSVSGAGDVNGDGYSDVIVGAPYFNNVQTDEGRAFVYHGSAGGLSATANWTAEPNQASAIFGYSVSGAGDVNGDGYSDVIVGAPGYGNGETAEGGAFVYNGGAGGLSATANWTAESNQINFLLGWSVAGAGDVNGDGYSDVVVGVTGYTNGLLEDNEGGAFVYHGSSSGLSASYNWVAESNQAEAQLGWSVAGAGDVNGDGYSDVIVGTPYYDSLMAVDGGIAFVYHGSPVGLSASYNWVDAMFTQDNSYLGWSVSSAGDVNGDGYSDVIVGVPGDGDYTGAALVYHGSASGLSVYYVWVVVSDQDTALLGSSVSGAGDVNGDGYSDIIVGAPRYDNGLTDEGRVYVYHGSAASLSLSPSWMSESNQPYAQLGFSVSSAGDVNGDGFSDMIVGTPGFDGGQNNEGRISVYYGDSSALSSVPGWTAESDQADAHLGFSVSGAGDVNGDGYSDVIAGADGYDNVETNEGGAFVYHGSSGGLSLSPSWTAESNQASAYFGCSVSRAGDVNGDGYSDVIVGAYQYDNGQMDEGGAFVYHGSSTGLSATFKWIAESNQADAHLGTSVSLAGDVNGDGYSDVIVGADQYDRGEIYEGVAFVYHGSFSGLSELYNWTAESDQEGAYFGSSVSSAGDVNGDGYSDVIVGAPYYDKGQTDEGRAFVYHGSSGGLSLSPDWTAESEQANAYFGCSVSSAGDVNGDGYSDVIVGAWFYDNGQMDEGRAFLYRGNSSGLSLSSDWTAESNQADARFGFSVSSAGDVNGDGYSDVIAGAFNYDNDHTDEGRVFLYYGNNRGISLIPRQYSNGYSHPIQLGNASGGTEVQLNILGRTPAGRGKVKMQWEIKELGQLFDGTSILETASWDDTGINGITISEDLTGLQEATAYHWRMRLKYSPVTYDVPVCSRWLSIGPNGWNETDFISTALSGIKDNADGISNLGLIVFPSVSTNIFGISFFVSEKDAKEDMNLKVYNKAGMVVRNIFTGRKLAGRCEVTWNGTNNSSQPLPNDIYFISLTKGKGQQIVKKIVLLR